MPPLQTSAWIREPSKFCGGHRKFPKHPTERSTSPWLFGKLVSWGFLPKPAAQRTSRSPRVLGRHRAGENATVRFLRPLWIDLGGIAKGYAVDRALKAMALAPDVHCCINAGGDLRRSGLGTERIGLRLPWRVDSVPIVEIADGALASSTGHDHMRRHRGRSVQTASRRRQQPNSRYQEVFASVAADDCMTADALTKVVLARGIRAESVLHRFRAVGYFYTPQRGWRTLGQPVT